jgi:Tol biopolymer transport system component
MNDMFSKMPWTSLLASFLLGIGLLLNGCDSGGSNAEGDEDNSEEMVNVDSPILYGETDTNIEGTIYTIQPDGSSRTQIVGSALTESVSWADDRSTIVYTAGSTLYRANPDGTGEEIILDREDDFFDLDASSDQIAFQLNENDDIYAVGLDGNNLLTVTNRQISNLSLSPDGSQILFNDTSLDGDLYTIPADGSASSPTQLTSGVEGEQSVWSPDGSQIVYRDDEDGNLYKVPADGSSDPIQLTDGDGENFTPDWYGSEIVFSSFNRNGESQSLIYKMDADGSDVTPLTDVQESEEASEDDQFPEWSPNGEGIVFTSSVRTDSNDENVFVMSSEGDALSPVTETDIPSVVIEW